MSSVDSPDFPRPSTEPGRPLAVIALESFDFGAVTQREVIAPAELAWPWFEVVRVWIYWSG
jgi:hypothetical protein